VAVEGPLIFDDEGMVVDAARAGVGLGYVIEEALPPDEKLVDLSYTWPAQR
jgi:hypothetical protein